MNIKNIWPYIGIAFVFLAMMIEIPERKDGKPIIEKHAPK